MTSTLPEIHATARALAAPPDALLAAILAAVSARPGVILALTLSGPARPGSVAADASALTLEHCLAALAVGARGVRIDAVPAGPAGESVRALVGGAVALLDAIGIGPAPVTLDAEPSLPSLQPLAALVLARPRGLRMRTCLDHLARAAGWSGSAPLPLPEGAPAGALSVSRACTLCMACVPECPTQALQRDGPMLLLYPDACVQCGLCVALCPEQAITPLPRLSAATPPVVLAQDEAAICPGCGAAFGSRRALDGVRARLAESGWAAQNPTLARRLALCEDCRAKP